MEISRDAVKDILLERSNVKVEEKVWQLLETLKADGQLAEKVFSQETPEAVQAILKDAGYAFSVEEILRSRDTITKLIEKKGELADDDLQNVAGGLLATYKPRGWWE
jgi:predicted ribosomally synthesized peptide with nif11-like leader